MPVPTSSISVIQNGNYNDFKYSTRSLAFGLHFHIRVRADARDMAANKRVPIHLSNHFDLGHRTNHVLILLSQSFGVCFAVGMKEFLSSLLPGCF